METSRIQSSISAESLHSEFRFQTCNYEVLIHTEASVEGEGEPGIHLSLLLEFWKKKSKLRKKEIHQILTPTIKMIKKFISAS